jgi:hypothetical protein
VRLRRPAITAVKDAAMLLPVGTQQAPPLLLILAMRPQDRDGTGVQGHSPTPALRHLTLADEELTKIKTYVIPSQGD